MKQHATLLLLFSLLFTLLLVPAAKARAGTLAMHLAVGDLCGQLAATEKDAAMLGFLSHAALDTWLRQYVVDWQDPAQARRYWAYLAADTALAGAVVWRATLDEENAAKRLLAIGGAILPDAIDAIYALVCPKCWMKGDMLFPWHDSVRVDMGPTSTMLWAAGIVAATW